ncbi:MAG: hypothetical protein AAF429_15130 [Pseudomonadota bacterium]
MHDYEAPPITLSEIFDETFYLSQLEGGQADNLNALGHYQCEGWKQHLDPVPWFSVSYYLAVNEDVAGSFQEPFEHYLEFGWKEGRNPNPHFSLAFHKAEYPNQKKHNPALVYYLGAWKSGQFPNAWTKLGTFLAGGTQLIEEPYTAWRGTGHYKFFNGIPSIQRSTLEINQAVLAYKKAQTKSSKGGVHLVVSHGYGGGTETVVGTHLFERVKASDCVILLRKSNIKDHLARVTIISRKTASFVEAEILIDRNMLGLFFDLLPISYATIESFVTFETSQATEIMRYIFLNDIAYDMYFHDFHMLSPRVHLADEKGIFFGDMSLERQNEIISEHGSPYNVDRMEDWHSFFGSIVRNARNRRVFCNDSRARLQQVFGEILFDLENIIHPPPRARKLAIVGHVLPHKGGQVVSDLTFLSDVFGSPLEFHIFGDIGPYDQLKYRHCVTRHGIYKSSKLPETLKECMPDLVFLTSTVPETFSLVLSEIMACEDYEVYAFDIGAISERLRAQGRVQYRLFELTLAQRPLELFCQLLPIP